MNARTLRWAASKGLVTVAPALKRPLNFYGGGIALEDAAEGRICALDDPTETPLDPEQQAFVRDRCQRNDIGFVERYWETPWRFSIEHFELREPRE